MSETLKAQAGHLRHTAGELLMESSTLKDTIERIDIDRASMAREHATLMRFQDAAGSVGELPNQAADIDKGIGVLNAELERTQNRLAVIEGEHRAALAELEAIEKFLREEQA